MAGYATIQLYDRRTKWSHKWTGTVLYFLNDYQSVDIEADVWAGVSTDIGCDLVHVLQVYAVVNICDKNEARFKKCDVFASICSGVIFSIVTTLSSVAQAINLMLMWAIRVGFAK